MKIILASGSPRRLQLLQQMGWTVEVHSLPFAEAETVNEATEKLDSLRKQFLFSGEKNHTHNEPVLSEKGVTLLLPYRNADLVCAYNALGKGRAAAKETGTGFPVVAADTIVVLGEHILGKPADTYAANPFRQDAHSKNRNSCLVSEKNAASGRNDQCLFPQAYRRGNKLVCGNRGTSG